MSGRGVIPLLCAAAVAVLLGRCGVSISGGFPVPHDSAVWEWTATVVPRSCRTVVCGGTLIDSWWVVTAAHCRAGTTMLMTLEGTNKDLCANRYRIAEVIRHPDFDPANLDNDIALVRLAEPVPIDDPGRMPLLASADPVPGDLLTFVGRGEKGPGVRLMEVELPSVATSECARSYPAGRITDNMLCAADPGGGRGTCHGDSGGPVLLRRDGRWTLVGIISGAGQAACASGKPEIFTRVSRYGEWIAAYVTAPRSAAPPDARP